jgi:sigma-B regulation protein RsbU (phosphoserine phosphatase)
LSGTERAKVNLPALLDATRRLNRALELEPLLQEIRDLCLRTFDAESINLLVWDEEKTRLEFYLAYNQIDTQGRRAHLQPGESVAGWIVEHNEPVVVNDLHWDLRYSRKRDQQIGFEARSVLGVPIHRGRSVMGVAEVLNRRGSRGFNDSDVEMLEALAEPIGIALENALLYRGLQREKMENEILFQIGRKLNQTLELDATLNLILDLLAEVLPYDAAGIALVGGTPSDIDMIQNRGYPPDSEDRFSLKVGQGAIGWVIQTGEPLRIPDVTRDRRYVNARPETRSELAVPMVSEEKVIGAFNLESNVLETYRPRDERMLVSLANQAAIAVQRARLYREVLRRQRLQDEVEVARAIQERLLPSAHPNLPGYQVSGRTIPSLEVGGDSYDIIPITDDQVGLMVGDVAGKGIPAAFILASFWAALRSEVRHNYEIRRTFENLNRLLREVTRLDQFVTAVYGVLDRDERVFTYVNAGHNPPILLRKDGEVEWLREGGLLLGILDDATYQEARIELEAGELLLFYTDGAIEATDRLGREYGEMRLIQRLREVREGSAAEIRTALEGAILQHCHGKAQDDVTLVILKVNEEQA